MSILKEINPGPLDPELEGLISNTLKLQNLMQRANSLEKTLMLGKTEGRRRRGRQRKRWHHRLNGRESEQTLGDTTRQGSLVCRSPRGRRESDTTSD